MDPSEEWRYSNSDLILQPTSNLLFGENGEGLLGEQLEEGNPFLRESFEPPPKTQAVAINREYGPKKVPIGKDQPKTEKKPEIEVLHADYHPYPQFWIKKNTLRPSIILTLNNCEAYNTNSLTVMAVAMDPHTHQPTTTARLTNDSVGIDDELTLELKKPAVKFSELKIYGDRSLGGKRGNDVQLAFCVYNKQTFPPAPMCFVLDPNPIAVYNRFDELPAPNIFKIIPNRVVCNQQTNVTIIGQFFKESKGKQSRQTKTICGVTLRNDLDIYPNSMDEMFPLMGPPQYSYVVKNADTHTFSMPFCCADAGFVLLNASNDGKTFGLGKLIEVQREPSGARLMESVNVPSGSEGRKRQFGFSDGSSLAPDTSSTRSPSMTMDTSAFFGNFSQLQQLVLDGASVNDINGEGNAPLSLACMSGSTSCVDLLLRNGARVNTQDKTKETALHHAARGGHAQVVRNLLLYGANPEIVNEEGCTPLHLAAGGGHLDVVDMLIEKMDDIELVDNDGLLALHYAVLSGDKAVVEALANEHMERGLSLDWKDCLGFTPLHWAVRMGKEAIVRCLVQCGADVDVEDTQSETAAFIAAHNSEAGILRILVQAGARLDVKNNQGKMAIDVAERDEVKQILSHPAEAVTLAAQPEVVDFKPSASSSTDSATQKLLAELQQLKLENGALAMQNKELLEQNKSLKARPKSTKDRDTDPSPAATRRTIYEGVEEEEKKGHVPYSGQNDYIAEEWWASAFPKGSAPLDEFLSRLLAHFTDDSLAKREREIAKSGIRDYFENSCSGSKSVTHEQLEQFLKLYGPIEGMQKRVADVYSLPFFHGFLSFEEASKYLKGRVGAFLIRYSQTQKDKGCFVLNVNRGHKKGSKSPAELIENYVVLWHSQQEHFSFYKQTYDSLRNFVADPVYAKILVEGVDNNRKYKL